AQVPRPSRAPNTSQQVFGIGGYAAGILQRLQGERTFSPWRDNSLFATATHRLRLPFATLHARMTKYGSTGSRSGTARPQRPVCTPIDPKYSGAVFRSCPPGPNSWTLNIQPFDQFRPHRGFLLARSTLPSSVARLLHTAGQVACLLQRFVDT